METVRISSATGGFEEICNPWKHRVQRNWGFVRPGEIYHDDDKRMRTETEIIQIVERGQFMIETYLDCTVMSQTHSRVSFLQAKSISSVVRKKVNIGQVQVETPGVRDRSRQGDRHGEKEIQSPSASCPIHMLSWNRSQVLEGTWESIFFSAQGARTSARVNEFLWKSHFELKGSGIHHENYSSPFLGDSRYPRQGWVGIMWQPCPSQEGLRLSWGPYSWGHCWTQETTYDLILVNETQEETEREFQKGFPSRSEEHTLSAVDTVRWGLTAWVSCDQEEKTQDLRQQLPTASPAQAVEWALKLPPPLRYRMTLVLIKTLLTGNSIRLGKCCTTGHNHYILSLHKKQT